MNLKLDLSMVNTILMVVVLILVIVACVRRYRENFTSNYFIQPLCDDEKYKYTLNCVRGSQGAGEGSEFEFTELSEIKSGEDVMDWAKSDNGILDKYTEVFPEGEIGQSKIDNQFKIMRLTLKLLLETIIQSFNVSQDNEKLQSLKNIEENASTYLSKNDSDKWILVDETDFDNFIKTNGNYDKGKATLINKLLKSNIPIKLLEMPEVDKKGKQDNNLRDLKDKKYKQLLNGGDNTDSEENYVIRDGNGDAINFNELLSEFIDEKKLKENWVKHLTANITNLAHLKLAYQSFMSGPEIEAKFKP